MSFNLPKRKYLTFAELLQRWGCQSNELRYAIVTGELKPCVLLDGEHSLVFWDEQADWRGDPVFFATLHAGSPTFNRQGWHYCQRPEQSGAYDCRFRMVTDDRDADVGDLPFALWFWLPEPLSMSDVERDGVFMLSEVARFEAGEAPVEKPIHTKERNTFLAIIASLAKEARISLDQPSKAAEAIVGAAESIGVTLSRRAIEEKLKLIPDAIAARGK